MNALIINSDDSWKLNEDEYSLDDYQKIVGGYIEGVTIGEDIIMYCNEEGKILGLPVNNIATDYVKSVRPFNDYICGNVVFTKIDKEGDSTTLTLDDIDNIISFIEIYQNR